MLTASQLLERARTALSEGRNERAIELCDLAILRAPTGAIERGVRAERGRALRKEGQFKKAQLDLETVLSARGDNELPLALDVQWELCLCLIEQKSHQEALDQLNGISPEHRSCRWYRRAAEVLSQLERHEEAVNVARQGWPSSGETKELDAYLRVLAQAGRHEHVLEEAAQSVVQYQTDLGCCLSVGASCNALGRAQEARLAFESALLLDPKCADAHCGLSYALLRLGRYRNGWRHHEFRQKSAGNCGRRGIAPWKGEPLAGKHAVIFHEQGFGDTVQFARFVEKVRLEAAETTLIVPASWTRLFSASGRFGSVRRSLEGFGHGDVQALVMSLPHLLSLDEIPALCSPYLSAEERLRKEWDDRLPSGPRVALAWQGNPDFAGEPWRSMPFSFYEPLLRQFFGTINFLSVQKGFGSEQLQRSSLNNLVVDWGRWIDEGGDSFVDSLAILSNVDLFITTDTGLAHLAGAAGVPTLLLLSQVADWRWGTEEEVTEWYPTVQLFRQRAAGDWAGVMDRVRARVHSIFRDLSRASPRVHASSL